MSKPKSSRVAVSKKERDAKLVADLLSDMDRSGLPPWRMPWVKNMLRQCNAVTGRPYRGINMMLTARASAAYNYDDHRWLTYRQAQLAGGHVRQGEQGVRIVFWRATERPDREPPEGAAAAETPRRFLIAREYTVFNARQVDNAALGEPPELQLPYSPPQDTGEFEAALSVMSDPPAVSWGHNQALYRPDQDVIEMPKPERFCDQSGLMETFWHELAHATGHPSRLGRWEGGSQTLAHMHERAAEEITAEITAAMLMTRHGAPLDSCVGNASYIAEWRQHLQDHPGHLIRAAQKAQQAYEYITGGAAAPESGSRNGGPGGG